MVNALRRRQMATETRDLDGWSLEDIYARYGRQVLTESEHDPELAAHLATEAEHIRQRLKHHRIRERSRPGYSYLLGCANAAMQTMFDPDTGPRVCGHSTPALQLAAACRVAIGWHLLAP
ncbi:hypothetical protein ACOZ38_29185 [Sphaerisporangium viridialbum]|uniref:hypothetical protein n=1 Tax=Sphaerisporangium viridialbum TaxID=46189 RepID=UPI003C761C16